MVDLALHVLEARRAYLAPPTASGNRRPLPGPASGKFFVVPLNAGNSDFVRLLAVVLALLAPTYFSGIGDSTKGDAPEIGINPAIAEVNGVLRLVAPHSECSSPTMLQPELVRILQVHLRSIAWCNHSSWDLLAKRNKEPLDSACHCSLSAEYVAAHEWHWPIVAVAASSVNAVAVVASVAPKKRKPVRHAVDFDFTADADDSEPLSTRVKLEEPLSPFAAFDDFEFRLFDDSPMMDLGDMQQLSVDAVLSTPLFTAPPETDFSDIDAMILDAFVPLAPVASSPMPLAPVDAPVLPLAASPVPLVVPEVSPMPLAPPVASSVPLVADPFTAFVSALTSARSVTQAQMDSYVLVDSFARTLVSLDCHIHIPGVPQLRF
ncbi:MAG: hypothetical protein Q7V62_01810 [Actinomycetota bacterium]|nr:hypothetical protein [Actinomycetota bacterium]